MQRQVYRLKAGNINRLKISSENLPDPGHGEVQIAVKAIGLNFADVFAILGLYSATPKGEFVPGLEYAGDVIAVGEGCTSARVGDRVMGVTRFGAYASHLCIDERYVVPLPEGWDYADGASYLVQVLTAYYALSELAGAQKGQTVLIHSAAGGVGIWANRICKSIGCTTIGTVGRSSKLSVLEAEEYDHGLVRDTRTFASDLAKVLDGRDLEIIMECIGGQIMKDGYKLLAPMGRHIVYGSAHYGDTSSRPNYPKLLIKYLTRPKIDPQNMIEENKSVMAFNLIYLFENVHIMHRLLTELKELNLGKPIVGHRYSFDQLPEAIREFQAGGTVGKVVVEV